MEVYKIMSVLTEHSINRFFLLHNLKTNPSSTSEEDKAHEDGYFQSPTISPASAGKFLLGFLIF